ncbi:MAG: hypothetical protein HWE10_15235 [Gammaproteobacteria bacterium]|nr:hypothetical protein [Gammaproteobacteria bacterium]
MNIKRQTYKNALILMIVTLLVQGCDSDTNDWSEFEKVLSDEFNISDLTLNNLKVSCERDNVVCFVENREAILKYTEFVSFESYKECSVEKGTTNSLIWNISKTTINAEFNFLNTALDNCSIQSYNILESESFATDINNAYRTELQVIKEVEEVADNSSGFFNFHLTASVTFDRSLFSSDDMVSIFTSDTEKNEAYSIISISDNIYYTTLDLASNEHKEINTNFVLALQLSLHRSSVKEILDKTWN